MKKLNFALLFTFVCFITSCEFHQSVNKDLTTGASSRGDGLSCDDVEIQINGEIGNRNEFSFGDDIVILLKNIEGLKKENDLRFPGLSMFIVQNNGDTLISEKDLLSSFDVGSDLYPLQLQAKFTAVMPHQNEEKYILLINVWDKKGEGTFSYELPFTISPNEFLKIKSSGVSFDHIYLWNNSKNQGIISSSINRSDEILLLLNGIKGLSEKDAMVYPKLYLEIVDSKGKKILLNKNLFAGFEKIGLKKELLTKQIPITISFTDGLIVNPVTIKAKLSDFHSNKSLEVSGEFVIK